MSPATGLTGGSKHGKNHTSKLENTDSPVKGLAATGRTLFRIASADLFSYHVVSSRVSVVPKTSSKLHD